MVVGVGPLVGRGPRRPAPGEAVVGRRPPDSEGGRASGDSSPPSVSTALSGPCVRPHPPPLVDSAAADAVALGGRLSLPLSLQDSPVSLRGGGGVDGGLENCLGSPSR